MTVIRSRRRHFISSLLNKMAVHFNAIVITNGVYLRSQGSAIKAGARRTLYLDQASEVLTKPSLYHFAERGQLFKENYRAETCLLIMVRYVEMFSVIYVISIYLIGITST